MGAHWCAATAASPLEEPYEKLEHLASFMLRVYPGLLEGAWVTFGKYKGMRAADVQANDESYCEWVVSADPGDNSGLSLLAAWLRQH